jgi:hypothetical protein
MIDVLVVWADGRRQMTRCPGVGADLLMPLDLPDGGWRPVPFVADVVEYPDGFHGPFESEWWIGKLNNVRRVKMLRFLEVAP